MVEPTFLVKIKRQYRPSSIRRFFTYLHRLNGKILLVTDAGYLMVITINETHKTSIEQRPEVALLGRVQINPRPIRHVRVDHMGRLISMSNFPIQSPNK